MTKPKPTAPPESLTDEQPIEWTPWIKAIARQMTADREHGYDHLVWLSDVEKAYRAVLATQQAAIRALPRFDKVEKLHVAGHMTYTQMMPDANGEWVQWSKLAKLLDTEPGDK